MRLTAFSDYSLRVLLYLAVHGDELATVGSIAEAYGISENHLVKVAHNLRKRGYVETVRGKGGGMRLARPPEQINLGALVREVEDKKLVECFDRASHGCRIVSACMLRGVLGEALEGFFAVLDRHTLADLLAPRRKLTRILMTPPPRRRVPAVQD